MLDTTSKGIFQDRPTQKQTLGIFALFGSGNIPANSARDGAGTRSSCSYSCPRAWLLTAGRALYSCAPTGVGLCKEEIHGQIGEDA